MPCQANNVRKGQLPVLGQQSRPGCRRPHRSRAGHAAVGCLCSLMHRRGHPPRSVMAAALAPQQRQLQQRQRRLLSAVDAAGGGRSRSRSRRLLALPAREGLAAGASGRAGVLWQRPSHRQPQPRLNWRQKQRDAAARRVPRGGVMLQRGRPRQPLRQQQQQRRRLSRVSPSRQRPRQPMHSPQQCRWTEHAQQQCSPQPRLWQRHWRRLCKRLQTRYPVPWQRRAIWRLSWARQTLGSSSLVLRLSRSQPSCHLRRAFQRC